MRVMLPIGPTLLDIVDNSLRIVSQDCASFKILNCMYLRRTKREGKMLNHLFWENNLTLKRTPMNDQNRSSPYHVNTISTRCVENKEKYQFGDN